MRSVMAQLLWCYFLFFLLYSYIYIYSSCGRSSQKVDLFRLIQRTWLLFGYTFYCGLFFFRMMNRYAATAMHAIKRAAAIALDMLQSRRKQKKASWKIPQHQLGKKNRALDRGGGEQLDCDVMPLTATSSRTRTRLYTWPAAKRGQVEEKSGRFVLACGLKIVMCSRKNALHLTKQQPGQTEVMRV